VRLVFTVLSAFSQLNLTGTTSSSTTSSGTDINSFNIVTGKWWIFLIMVLIMEYIVVGIYMLVGALMPTTKEEAELYGNPSGNYELRNRGDRQYAAV
jgi:hypothetical protein